MVSPALTVLPIDDGAAVAVEARPEARVAGGGGAGAAGGGVAGPVSARGLVADAAARIQRRSPGSSSVAVCARRNTSARYANLNL